VENSVSKLIYLPLSFESQWIRKNQEGDKLGLNEWLKGYELSFGSSLNPNGSEARLLGRIPPNGLVERVRTQRSDQSVVAGALGLGWAGWG
jgi:hypothetical protein